LAPRSWPSSPGFATTTLILLASIGGGSLRGASQCRVQLRLWIR
jgi:hypothetical protein